MYSAGVGNDVTIISSNNSKIVKNPDPDNPVISDSDGLSTSDAFMKLMIEQLKNQDPLSPMEAETFTQQLAALNSLQQLVSLNEQISASTRSSELAQASNLIGTYVEGFDSENEAVVGEVERVEVIEDAVTLKIGDQMLLLSQVLTVDDAYEDTSTEG